jgi:Flp pilus assembly protein TadD
MLGQYLNQQHARLETIAEVDNGFMVFYYPDGRYQKQRTLMVPYVDLLELNGAFAPAARGRKGGILQGGANRDKRHPLLPQGYDLVFRALGHKLDQRHAICVTICETRNTLYLDYWIDKATFVIRDQRRQAVSHHQGETFDAAGVARMVDLIRDGLAQESSRHLNALRINPHDHISTLAAALLLEDEGNYRDAESFCSRVVAHVPQHTEALYHQARLAYIHGDQRTALRAIRQALSLREDIAAFHDLHGRALLQLRKGREAVVVLECATALEPENPILHQHLATAYATVGRKEDAARETALVSPPQAAPAWEMVRETLLDDYAPVSAEQTVQEAPRVQGILPAQEALLPPLAEQTAARDHDRRNVPGAWSGILPDLPAAGTPSAHAAPQDRPLTTVFDLAAMLPASQTPLQQDPAIDDAAADIPRLTTFPTDPVDILQDAPVAEIPSPTPPDASRSPRTSLAMRLGAAQVAEDQAAPDGAQDRAAPGDAEESAPTPAPAIAAPAPSTPARQDARFADPLPVSASGSLASFLNSTPSPRAPFDPRLLDAGLPTSAVAPPSTAGAAGEAQSTPGAVELAAEILTVQRALDAEPERADLHRKLGFLLARQGRTAEAAAEFRKALQHSRTSL